MYTVPDNVQRLEDGFILPYAGQTRVFEGLGRGRLFPPQS